MHTSTTPLLIENKNNKKYLFFLTLAALGIVFGDIGTSPLYAMKECFSPPHGVAPTKENILGVLSLIVWSLITIVSVKYLTFVVRADNQGEGGVLALMALATSHRDETQKVSKRFLVLLGLFGASLLYGDGMITPAISVLSAVEGLKVATPFFEPYIIPITLIILCLLFFFQYRGTGAIGSIFGPIMLVWFSTLALLGTASIVHDPVVLEAINPFHGFGFILTSGWIGFVVLGSVFLVVTGAEALYADMGHFGRVPIWLGWYCVALIGLLLNYFGQGALLLRDPSAAENPFYHLSPSWFLYVLVILSTLATVIASQALISGAFSLTRQAIQLGYLPRLSIRHTSSRTIGQIYIPPVNLLLFICTSLLVVCFRSSSALAAAYGIAVSTTMVITTLLTYIVARQRWGWSSGLAGSVTAFFLGIDLIFFAANATKIFHGGWVTLAIGAVFFTLLATWRKGREILGERLQTLTPPLKQFLANLKVDSTIRVPGIAIVMTRNLERTPPALVHNVKHNKVVHKTVVLTMIHTEDLPSLREDDRILLAEIGDGFYSMTIRYGFMEVPNVPEILKRCKDHGLEIRMQEITYFLGRETLLATPVPGMAMWRESLFSFMSQNALRATAFYKIPPEQVIEIGFQVEL